MRNIFKRKPKVETVSKAEHDRIVMNITEDRDLWKRWGQEAIAKHFDLKDRLNQIAALETPNCAHIGKRMARIARGEVQAREKQAAE